MGFFAFVKGIVAAGLVVLMSAPARAGNDALAQGYDLISNGERIELKEGDISIVPPLGWEVFTNHPSLTLLMQVPHDASLKYQRTIQVAAFGGKKYIDEVTAREYEQVIVRKFSQLTASIEDYKVREHQMVDMADGRDGILVYTEFMLDGVPMMQAHILVSSEKRHYLMTFTDLADHFEKEEYSQYLNEAWTSLISVELAGGAGASILKKLGLGKFKRFQTLIYIGLGFVGFGMFAFLFSLVRKRWSGNKYGEMMGDGGRDDYEVTGPVTELKGTGSMHATGHSAGFTMGHAAGPATVHPTNHPTGLTTGHSMGMSQIQGSLAPKTNTTLQGSHLMTAHADDESGMEDFLDDEDEDDKAI
jgi:hypothetical protein